MTIEEAIKKSIEGGWIVSPYKFYLKEIIGDDARGRSVVIRFIMEGGNYKKPFPSDSVYSLEWLFLNPKWWQALGRAMEWGENGMRLQWGHKGVAVGDTHWLFQQHKFIDHLAEGKTAEDYFKDLN